MSYGIFEVSQSEIVVDESMYYFDLRIIRMQANYYNTYTRTDIIIDNPAILSEEELVDDIVIEIDYDL